MMSTAQYSRVDVFRSDTPIDTEHFVQFYESDEYLLSSLASYIATGIVSGETAVIVATGDHLDGLEKRLLAQGFNPLEVTQSGKLITLDARSTLPKLFVNGELSAERFRSVIGSVVTAALIKGSRLRVFGELVALLCDQGNFAGAIQLEGFWNELLRQHAFKLMCAYPLSHFAEHSLAEPLVGVCSAHSRVVPAESYSSLIGADDQGRHIVSLQQKASALELEIAERNRAEEKLRDELARSEKLLMREQILRGEAESANRMKDDFLATVSHELRTPLNAIIGWSHMLRSGRLDAQNVEHAVETIERNAKSQAQLVEDILDVSRMISGKLKLDMALVDIAAVINAAIDSVQLAADSKQITLDVIFQPSARHVLGDASRLQQVVWNLLSNAIKFTPPGGRVTIKLEHVKCDIQVKISDTGQGITADFLPCVFDRFRQIDSSSTRRHGGLGLGLAIVRHLIELHGGTVAVESEGEGCGATFTVNLPAAVLGRDLKTIKRDSRSSLSRKYRANGTSLPSLIGIRVLLVDDDSDSLHFLSTYLMQREADVRVAHSASEALQVIESYDPQVLVFDLAMPEEDGFSLIEKIREREAWNQKRVPAIALTAHVRVDDRVRALAGGFDLFVPKPVEVEELVTAIANLVVLKVPPTDEYSSA